MTKHTRLPEPMNVSRLGPAGLLVGVIGIAVTLGGLFFGDRAAFIQGYLYGYVFWLEIALGCLGLAIFGHTVRARWALPLMRIFEAGGSARMFAMLGVLYLPICFNAKALFPWADPEKIASNKTLAHMAGWMNPPAVLIRMALLFIVWAVIANILSRSTAKQEASGDEAEARFRSSFGAGMMVVFVVTVTVLCTDLVMSLSADWYSTMFGFIFVDGAALGALALATFVACWGATRAPFRAAIDPLMTKDWGNLLFTLTMVWGYFNFSQVLIIWNGNLPQTSQYYQMRGVGGWNWIGFAVIMGQLAVPFLALLAPVTKRVPGRLAFVAAWILVFRVLDIHYIVNAFCQPTATITLPALISLFGFGGVWLSLFSSSAKGANVIVTYDPRLLEAAH